MFKHVVWTFTWHRNLLFKHRFVCNAITKKNCIIIDKIQLWQTKHVRVVDRIYLNNTFTDATCMYDKKHMFKHLVDRQNNIVW